MTTRELYPSIRISDKEYQRKKRLLGLVDKTEEYRKWREKNPIAYKAQQLINYSIRKGEIKRDKCCICNSKNTYAHHEDYNKPFDIIWLCPSCHKKYHLGLVELQSVALN